MEPKRRIFWMLAFAFMALISSHDPAIGSVFFISGMIWTLHCAVALAVEEDPS